MKEVTRQTASSFARARWPLPIPADQFGIGGPRIGVAGPIDPLVDLEMLLAAARERPGWHFILLGPVVGISRAALPRRGNLHWLGPRPLDDLPAYVSDWDVALVPLLRRPSACAPALARVREYLEAGRPVVSTSIPEVVRHYAGPGVVRIADDPRALVAAIEATLGAIGHRGEWRARVDRILAEPPPRPAKVARPRSRARRGDEQSARMGRALRSVRRRARASA